MGNPSPHSLMSTNQAINSHVPQLHRSIMNGDVGGRRMAKIVLVRGGWAWPWTLGPPPRRHRRRRGSQGQGCSLVRRSNVV